MSLGRWGYRGTQSPTHPAERRCKVFLGRVEDDREMSTS